MESKYSVAEISYMVGFTTPSYFTAAFRHFMGCTPSEYVRQNGKK
jgi:AraC-like DNA-binding protein